MVKSGDTDTSNVHQAICYVLIQREKIGFGVKAPSDTRLIRHNTKEITRSLQLT
jgi:hypothetical protein